MSELHYNHAAPYIKPAYVQRALSVELPGYPFDLGGVIDLQEEDGTIRDTKVKDKTPSAGFADDDDQMTLYAALEYLHSGNLPKLVYDCLIDTKIEKYVPLETARVADDFDVLLRRIDAACNAIEKGVFLPAKETDWWCGEYSCWYWKSCKFVKRSRRVADTQAVPESKPVENKVSMDEVVDRLTDKIFDSLLN